VETKVTESELMASNRKRGQGSSQTVAPAEEEEEEIVRPFLRQSGSNPRTLVARRSRGKETFFRAEAAKI
jgi:hypothetical protein